MHIDTNADAVIRLKNNVSPYPLVVVGQILFCILS